MATTVVQFDEPRWSRWVFGSSRTAWIWLAARLWLGWEWLHAGWGKVLGGNITWKVWEWGSDFALTGSRSIGWVRSGTIVTADGTEVYRGIGDSVAGFAARAIEGTEGSPPDVAYSWYVNFLEFVRDDFHPILGPLVAIGEFTIGIALIVGAFTGIAAFLGALLNFSFMFAGSSGANPGMVLVSLFLVLAWRNAGWYGLDRYLLPKLGVPWQRQRQPQPQPQPEAESASRRDMRKDE
jgi:thiosulfate dehydrogenase [quinone] large subunit